MTKKVKIENDDSETSIIKNSLLLAMLLNIAKAYEMLQFGENKAYAHNEVISVLLLTRKDTRANFCFGCYHLNFMKKL